MFKRINKITALLVAAAAVVSIVPATGVSAAERLGTKSGTITNAIAFKDGKYIYEGYRTDDNDDSVYFNAGAGEKDKEIEDGTEYSFGSADYKGVKYLDKYAVVENDGDEYLLDLSNGKVSDEQTTTDDLENARTKLKTALKKTEMYEDIKTTDAVFKKIEKVDSGKFGDNLYMYTTTTTASAGSTVGVNAYGFTNDSGKYVHASYIANMYVYSKAKDKAVKVEKYNNGDIKVLLKDMKYLAQDKDNFYTFTTVEVKEAGFADSEQYFIQKISKSQGDKEKEAYLPKDVTSYQLNKENQDGKDKENKPVTTTIYDNGDSKDAYDIVANGPIIGTKADGNTIYVYKMAGSDAKVFKVDLKKVKVDVKEAYDTDGNTTKVEKVDTYLAKKDGDSSQGVENGQDSVSIDVDGNLWAINKGSIYKFTGKDKKEMFTCDRSLDSLDVYNEGSLVAWEEGQDVYTTVQEGSSVTNAETTPAQTGWVNTATGWTFYDAAGKQVVGSWVNAGGVWYMMKADGIMATGWYNDNGTWYYLNASGAMTTGWLNDGGTWYYLQSSGAMKTGWLNDNGTWYYLQASGAMAANTVIDGYVLNGSGAWIK